MTSEQLRNLLGPGFQLTPGELAWLRKAIAVELAKRPRSITAEEVVDLFTQLATARNNPAFATKLREQGFPDLRIADGPRESPDDEALDELTTALSSQPDPMEDPKLKQMLEELKQQADSTMSDPLFASHVAADAQDARTPLERCQEAYTQLSTSDQGRFIYWLTHGHKGPDEGRETKKRRRKKK